MLRPLLKYAHEDARVTALAEAARVEPQPAALAGEQRRVELPLQLGQRHAGRRLGQMQPLGGGAHAAQQRDLHEHLELARADVVHHSIL